MAQDDTPAVEDSRMSSEPASDRSEPETSMADRTNDAPVSPSEDIVSEDIAVERAGPEPEPPSAAVARSSNTATKDEDRTESPWVVPEDLLERLETLACECECTEWSLRVEQGILELTGKTMPSDEHAAAILRQLREAASEVDAADSADYRAIRGDRVFGPCGTAWCAAWTCGN